MYIQYTHVYNACIYIYALLSTTTNTNSSNTNDNPNTTMIIYNTLTTTAYITSRTYSRNNCAFNIALETSGNNKGP